MRSGGLGSFGLAVRAKVPARVSGGVCLPWAVGMHPHEQVLSDEHVQILAGGDVTVEGRRGDAHVLGDGADREALETQLEAGLQDALGGDALVVRGHDVLRSTGRR